MGISMILGGGLALLAAVGSAYHVAAGVAVWRFFARPARLGGAAEAVTVVKPLYGAEPRLAENLASFVAQDYPAPVQVLCGVNAAEDAAAGVAAQVAGVEVWPGPRLPGANGKMGNCAAMMVAARHGVVVLSDSDMVVGRDYLARVVAALLGDGVGAVSCFYLGRGDAGGWSRLGAAMIDWGALPNMVFGHVAGLADPCMGSTIALRRGVLARIGGFGAFVDVLADDHAIGAAVRGLGLRVEVPAMLLVHAGAEGSARALWRQHLRWAVTIRGLAGAGHYGSGVTFALPLALVAAPLLISAGCGAIAAGALAGALMARVFVVLAVRRAARGVAGYVAPSVAWLPVVDVFGFAVFVASLMARRIDWRGAGLTTMAAGRIRAR